MKGIAPLIILGTIAGILILVLYWNGLPRITISQNLTVNQTINNTFYITNVTTLPYQNISGAISLSYVNLSGSISINASNITGTWNASRIDSVLAVNNGGTGNGSVFTQGSVVFAGASGVYSQDNTEFFWNELSNRLGIGTTNPYAKLQVNGSVGGVSLQTNESVRITNGTSNFMFINSSLGFVGINTETPTFKTAFEVRGELNPYGAIVANAYNHSRTNWFGDNNLILISNTSGSSSSLAFLAASGDGLHHRAAIVAIPDSAGTAYGDLFFYTRGADSATAKMAILHNGNIGIGTDTPISKLNVVGAINATLGFPNFVAPIDQTAGSSVTTSGTLDAEVAKVTLTAPEVSGQMLILGQFSLVSATVPGDFFRLRIRVGNAEVATSTTSANLLSGRGTETLVAIVPVTAGTSYVINLTMIREGGTGTIASEAGRSSISWIIIPGARSGV